MAGTLGSTRAKTRFSFGILLLLSFLSFTLPFVEAQAPFDLGWTFDYSPLVSAAPNSLHLRIDNTGLTPIRILSVSIRFPWMEANTYISSGNSQTPQDIAPEQVFTYTIPFQLSADVLTGRYQMNTLLQYQIFQDNQWTPEAITYVLGVVVLGRSSSLSLSFDPYDGRFYSALALLTLIGWYLPKKLRPKAKG